jgi:hypothetical protein
MQENNLPENMVQEFFPTQALNYLVSKGVQVQVGTYYVDCEAFVHFTLTYAECEFLANVPLRKFTTEKSVVDELIEIMQMHVEQYSTVYPNWLARNRKKYGSNTSYDEEESIKQDYRNRAQEIENMLLNYRKEAGYLDYEKYYADKYMIEHILWKQKKDEELMRDVKKAQKRMREAKTEEIKKQKYVPLEMQKALNKADCSVSTKERKTSVHFYFSDKKNGQSFKITLPRDEIQNNTLSLKDAIFTELQQYTRADIDKVSKLEKDTYYNGLFLRTNAYCGMLSYLESLPV